MPVMLAQYDKVSAKINCPLRSKRAKFRIIKQVYLCGSAFSAIIRSERSGRMATVEQLVSAVAGWTEREESEVYTQIRRLREAGVIPPGSRGRGNARQFSAFDALL